MVGLSPSERTLDIGTNRRNPNRIESHTLNIVEFIDNTPPITTAIPPHTSITSSIATIRQSESISNDPIHQRNTKELR